MRIDEAYLDEKIKKISLAAANGVKTADVDGDAELILWHELKDLYADQKAGKITVEEAKAKKDDQSAEYKDRKKAIAKLEAEKEFLSIFWKNIERTGIAYAKAEQHTPEGDDFFHAIYALRPEIGAAGNMDHLRIE